MTQVSGCRRGHGTSRIGRTPVFGGGLDRNVLGVDAADSRDLPSEDYGNTQRSTGSRITLVHPLIQLVP